LSFTSVDLGKLTLIIYCIYFHSLHFKSPSYLLCLNLTIFLLEEWKLWLLILVVQQE
jgi:hypothetical protein